MTEIKVRRRKLAEYQADPNNPNKGSDRGRQMIRESLTQRGAGGALTADAEDKMIGGNQTMQAALDAGIDEVIEVELPPNVLLVGKRTDIRLDDPDDQRARQLSLDLNRASDFRQWDADVLRGQVESGLLIDPWFDGDEYADLIKQAEAAAQVAAAITADAVEADGSVTRGLTDRAAMLKAVLYARDVGTFERALRATGIDNRADALVEVCRVYLAHLAHQSTPKKPVCIVCGQQIDVMAVGSVKDGWRHPGCEMKGIADAAATSR